MRRVILPYTRHEKYTARVPRHHKNLLDNGATWLTGDVIVYADGFPVLLRIDARPKDIPHLEALYSHAVRHRFDERGVRRPDSGTTYAAETFGASQPTEIRWRRAVAMAHFNFKYPRFTECAETLVERGWAKIRKHCRDMYDAIDAAPKALDCWRIRGTPFTSGVINKSVTMPYHRDRGNVPATGSLMWVSRRMTTGGHLHIPELNAVVDCCHGTMLAFYGEIFWHGVTLIRGLSRAQAERYSLVAYAKMRILSAQDPHTEHQIAALRSTAAADDVRDTVLKYD